MKHKGHWYTFPLWNSFKNTKKWLFLHEYDFMQYIIVAVVNLYLCEMYEHYQFSLLFYIVLVS
jgi:hypothetical protein